MSNPAPNLPPLPPRTFGLKCLLGALGIVGACSGLPAMAAELQSDNLTATPPSEKLNAQEACLPDWITPRPAQWPTPDQRALATLSRDTTSSNDFFAQPIQIRADQLEQPNRDQLLFQGDVQLLHPQALLQAQRLALDIPSKQANLFGQVQLLQAQFSLTAEQVVLQPNAVQIEQAHYQILPSRAYGDAQKIRLDQNRERAFLDQANLTTCRLDSKGRKDWSLQAEQIEIDRPAQRVIARDATLRVRNLPVFYTPYLNYPLNDRASGLLFPEFGNYKALNNMERTQYLKLPYFFAIAPNFDATLTPIFLSQQDLALDNELRYLGEVGPSLQRLNLKTGVFRSEETGEDPRWRVAIQNQQQWGEHLSAQINWNQTSDRNVYNDVPFETADINATHAPQQAQITYQRSHFSAYALHSGYAELINFQNNYEKRPEVGLRYAAPLDQIFALPVGQLSWDLQTQMTDFQLKNPEANRAEGRRWHSQASVQFRENRAAGNLNAQLNTYYTDYALEDPVNGDRQRFLPQAVLGAGLVFEQPLEVGKQNYRQTLEPRVQYLYTPYQAQQHLPLFDTALRSLDFSNLFALNPFVGNDRIADSHQVSVAINSRFIDSYGKERLNLGIGQSYRFEASRVLQEAGISGDSGASDLYTLAQLSLDHLRLHSTLVFDPQEQTISASSHRAFWEINSENQLFINHLKLPQSNNNSLIQTTESLLVGGFRQLNPNWQMSILGNYDLKQDRIAESELALRYDNCCWAFAVSAQRTQLENDLYNDSIRFQFELKGLSNHDTALNRNLSNLFNF
ncbi:MAG: LPS-assembly protein LptD [Thiotrichales bacterium]|nr:LPS-assembly protein LptD [Thiotrichales bacterium]